MLYQLLGYIILRLRYPNTEEHKKILEEKYQGLYSDVALQPILKIVGFVFIIALTAMLIGVIYAAFTNDRAVL
ncbi:hypothetical protein [Olleya sp. Bg11-27]|uniref:hypothetical protein n=1 Tax=Olleya sp. Bg11-27 TaxID=2058135 RepID=UPI000C307FA4|nr:hypothetical protein [Olleya sp. Bg11-27]AUC77530.1 hypothetical protein CW732_18325 [Olleya sp. Bg11-27]